TELEGHVQLPSGLGVLFPGHTFTTRMPMAKLGSLTLVAPVSLLVNVWRQNWSGTFRPQFAGVPLAALTTLLPCVDGLHRPTCPARPPQEQTLAREEVVLAFGGPKTPHAKLKMK